jgi:multiple antibiotic resistance protein
MAVRKMSVLSFFNVFIKFFFLLTPFFALSMFITLTTDKSSEEKKRLALRITFSVCIISLIIFLFGDRVFWLFGITIDAFRIGAGALLFLTAISLVQSKGADTLTEHDDIAVVPLAMPIIAGPATIGTIIIMSSEVTGFAERVLNMTALFTAVLCVGSILYASTFIERMLKRKGINILSKITGLIISAIAAQLVFTGIRNFLK